ncbi:MAG: LCP family protein [bacterium]
MNQSSGKIKIWIFIIILTIVGLFCLLFLKTSFTVNKVIAWQDVANILPFSDKLPEKDPNRINVLILGMRGLEDPGDGKMLSDTIIIASIKKDTGKIALISIPRDLYVDIWCDSSKRKINSAHAYGGLDCAKKTVAMATNLYIDYAISVDFKALKETIDTLGGITIYLDEPFVEDFQWWSEGWEENENWFIKEIEGEEKWVFYVPEGRNDLDGDIALYYVRSRYSTNDFDRMRRQQQVLMAIKDKAFSLGVLANPIKIYNLLDVLGRNVRTDIGLADIKNFIGLSSDLDTKDIKKIVFDISTEGLLYHTFIDEQYVLLPIDDNFDKIQEACKNIFD